MSKGAVLTIEDVIEKSKSYLKEEDVRFIQKAYEFAEKAHAHQFGKSGEGYIVHPVQVASILIDLELDPQTKADGFLHDVVEYTDTSIEIINEDFEHKE